MNSSKNVPVITIDGPSGTGKGTICHMLANFLNWHVLDSGILYRALALATREKNVNLDQIEDIIQLAHTFELRFESPTQIFLNGNEVYTALRSEQCGQDASIIGVNPEIRQALLARQRAFARSPGLVTDGRDMGTVIFPDAIVKIFLDASAEERAKRRFFQLQEKGIHASLAEVIDELVKRDMRDAQRVHAPLKPAKDAVLIDTTGLTAKQVFDLLIELLAKHPFFVNLAHAE